MEKLNIAELLKDCPKGMELDCTIYDSVYFDGINNSKTFPINIGINTVGTWCSKITLDKYGRSNSHPNSKCVIFPKGKATWEGFVPQIQFKEGDIIYNRHQRRICIFRYHNNSLPCISYCRYNCYHHEFEILKDDLIVVKQDYRLATEEEKQKLFDAIKANGYKWNPETKTLEKLIEPKFNIGDTITNGKTSITIGYIDNEYYYEIGRNISNRLFIKNQDEWNLVPNKFDITTLKPFDKVLVRCNELEIWHISFFEKYNRELTKYPFICLNKNKYSQCIPYQNNEHLLDTADNCADFYKTW